MSTKRDERAAMSAVSNESSPTDQIDHEIESLLSTIAQLKVSPGRRARLGLRYYDHPDVQYIVNNLQLPSETSTLEVNAVLAALKFILKHRSPLPRQCADPPVAASLQNWLSGLQPTQRTFVRLLGDALRNLTRQCEEPMAGAYTDVLIIFAPVFFPGSENELRKFLAAIEATLAIIEMRGRQDGATGATASALPRILTDSAYGSDEEAQRRGNSPRLAEDDHIWVDDELEFYDDDEMTGLSNEDEQWSFLEDFGDETDLSIALDADPWPPDRAENAPQCHRVNTCSPTHHYYQLVFFSSNKA